MHEYVKEDNSRLGAAKLPNQIFKKAKLLKKVKSNKINSNCFFFINVPNLKCRLKKSHHFHQYPKHYLSPKFKIKTIEEFIIKTLKLLLTSFKYTKKILIYKNKILIKKKAKTRLKGQTLHLIAKDLKKTNFSNLGLKMPPWQFCSAMSCVSKLTALIYRDEIIRIKYQRQ